MAPRKLKRPSLTSAARSNPRFFSAMLVDALGSGLFLPFSLIYFMTVTNLDLAEVGAAVAVSKLASLPLGPAAGTAVDRWGAFPVAKAGNYIRAAGYLLFLVPQQHGLTLLVLTVVALGDRAYWSAHGTMIGELAPDSLDDWYALTSVTRNAGLGLGGLLAAGTLGAAGPLGLKVLVLTNAITFLAAGLLLFGMRDRRIQRERSHDHGDAAWRVVLHDRSFAGLVAVKLAFVYCAVVLPTILPIYLEASLGLPIAFGGFLFALNCVLVVALQAKVVAVTHRRRVMAIAVAGALYAVAAALFVAAGVRLPVLSLLLCVGAIFVYTMGEMAVAPSSDALATDLAPRRLRGRYLSLYATAWSMGAVVGPLGATATFAIDPNLFWAVFAAVALTGGLGALALRRASEASRPAAPSLE